MAKRDDVPGTGALGTRLLLALGLLSASGPLAMDFYLASLPAVQRALGTGPTAVQLTVTAFLLGLGIGQVAWGPVSDRYGRLRPLLAGATVSVLAAAVCVLAPNVQVLVGARFVQALAASAGAVTARAIIADLAEGRTAARAMSLMTSVNSIAPVVAPLVGGALAGRVSWRGILAVVMLAMGAQLLAVVTTVRETLPAARRQSAVRYRQTLRLLACPAFRGHALTSMFAFGAVMAYISSSSFVYQRVIGTSSLVYGVGFALNASGMIAGGLVSARLAGRGVPPARMVARALPVLAVAAFAALVVAVTGPAWLLTGPFLVVLGAMGFVMGNTAALALAAARPIAGSASAVLGGLNFLFGGLASALGGLAGGGSAVPVCAVMAFSAACAGISFALTRGREVFT